MVVIPHQAVSMYFKAKLDMSFLQTFKKCLIVRRLMEYLLAPSTTIHDGVEGIFYILFSGGFHHTTRSAGSIL